MRAIWLFISGIGLSTLGAVVFLKLVIGAFLLIVYALSATAGHNMEYLRSIALDLLRI